MPASGEWFGDPDILRVASGEWRVMSDRDCRLGVASGDASGEWRVASGRAGAQRRRVAEHKSGMAGEFSFVQIGDGWQILIGFIDSSLDPCKCTCEYTLSRNRAKAPECRSPCAPSGRR